MEQDTVKTLGVIKQLIELGDSEAIGLMVGRMQQLENADTFSHILAALESQRFDDAILLIEDFEQQLRQVSRHYDPIVSALKIELHFQENELNLLRADRDEMAKKIDNFQARYHAALGDFLDRVLYLRMEKLRLQAQADPRLQLLFESASRDYTDYHEAHTSPIKGLLYRLDDESQRELKRLYRKASLICHPDCVAEEQKEKAQAMFEELHEAYVQNDLKKLRLIAELLEKAGTFEPLYLRIDDMETLRLRIERTMMQMEEVNDEIAEIQASDAYRTLEGITESWDVYLNRLAENLKMQIKELEHWHLLHTAQN
ncbi:MAG: DnaJ domain-containing protein [Phaeodactylibacter sp.]|nr:DnaJ domain-containing protein [Phaeodactylibacter sp.]